MCTSMWQRTTGNSIAEVDGFYLSVWKSHIGSTFWNWDIRNGVGQVIRSSVREPSEYCISQEKAEARVVEISSGLSPIEWKKPFEWIEVAEWKGVKISVGTLLRDNNVFRGYASFEGDTFQSNDGDKEDCRKEVEAWARRRVYGQA